MKKNIFAVLIIIGVCFVINAADNVVVPKNNSTVFVKYDQVWGFAEEKDLENPPKNAKGTLLTFGNKVIVTWSKKVKERQWIQVQLPDKTRFWVPLDYFTTRFIVISQKDVKNYSQPDTAYPNKAKLQVGYLGYLIKEQDGWLNVLFDFYAPRNPEEKSVYPGSVWINSAEKNIFIDDITVAKDANSLISAYNKLYGKAADKAVALKKLKKAIEDSEGRTNIAIDAIKSLIEKLEPVPQKTEATASPLP